MIAIPFAIVGVVGLLRAARRAGPSPAAAARTYVATVLTGALISPFTGGVLALQYYDQRFRKEGHDIELLNQSLHADRGDLAPRSSRCRARCSPTRSTAREWLRDELVPSGVPGVVARALRPLGQRPGRHGPATPPPRSAASTRSSPLVLLVVLVALVAVRALAAAAPTRTPCTGAAAVFTEARRSGRGPPAAARRRPGAAAVGRRRRRVGARPRRRAWSSASWCAEQAGVTAHEIWPARGRAVPGPGVGSRRRRWSSTRRGTATARPTRPRPRGRRARGGDRVAQPRGVRRPRAAIGGAAMTLRRWPQPRASAGMATADSASVSGCSWSCSSLISVLTRDDADVRRTRSTRATPKRAGAQAVARVLDRPRRRRRDRPRRRRPCSRSRGRRRHGGGRHQPRGARARAPSTRSATTPEAAGRGGPRRVTPGARRPARPRGRRRPCRDRRRAACDLEPGARARRTHLRRGGLAPRAASARATPRSSLQRGRPVADDLARVDQQPSACSSRTTRALALRLLRAAASAWSGTSPTRPTSRPSTVSRSPACCRRGSVPGAILAGLRGCSR